MCYITQTFAACHHCGHASLNPNLQPPTHCEKFPSCPMSLNTIIHKSEDHICEMCRLAEVWKGFDPYVRPVAPTHEVAEVRGTMTSRDWKRAFREQHGLVDIVKNQYLACGEDHDAALDKELSFRNRWSPIPTLVFNRLSPCLETTTSRGLSLVRLLSLATR